MKILFATANLNKVREISALLPSDLHILSLRDIELVEEIPETSPTLEGNAQQKADFITQRFGLDCFADDTGLEIEALNGAPSVRSARYAGEERSDTANMDRVLQELEGSAARSAQFRTVIALNLNGQRYFFEGSVKGEILLEKRGEHGFGYDPIFLPVGSDLSFAEMSLDEKNTFSHRARAFSKMIQFLHGFKA